MFRALVLSIIAGSVIFGMTACAPKSQDDCGFVQNVYGQRISWKGKLPINLVVHHNFPSEHLPALQSAVQKWNDTFNKQMFVITSTNNQGPIEPRRDSSNIVYWMNTWESDKNSEQARSENRKIYR